MKRLNQRPDVTVLENQGSALSGSSDNDIDHSSGQVVGRNDVVREQHTKCGVDRAQKAVGEIRFLPGLHGIDIRRPEEINAGEPGRT